MSEDLHSQADSVSDEQSLIEFISSLAADRAKEVVIERAKPSSPYGPGAKGWENGSIEAFLEAATAWAEASKNGLPMYQVPDNPYQRFAQILLMGKHYE